MDFITSSQNQFVKLATSLQDKKGRDSNKLFLAEGVNLLKDMPNNVVVKYIFTTKERLEEATKLNNRYKDSILYCVSSQILEKISDTKTPYGIIAVCEKFGYEFELPKFNALLLDNISDAGNLGTIIRTAAAADFKYIYLYNCVDIFSPKVVRATLGGLFKVQFYDTSLVEALEVVSKTNSIALDMNGENIQKKDIKAPVTLVMGSEAHGISSNIKEKVEKTISIPMKNNIESLNVSIAAAIAMYSIKEV